MDTVIKIVFAVLLFGAAVCEVVKFVKQLKVRKARPKNDASPSSEIPHSDDN